MRLALHADSREILAIVQAADDPVQVRAVGEELGLQVAVRGKREVSRRPTIFAEVIRMRPSRASRTSRTPDPRPAPSLRTAQPDANGHASPPEVANLREHYDTPRTRSLGNMGFEEFAEAALGDPGSALRPV